MQAEKPSKLISTSSKATFSRKKSFYNNPRTSSGLTASLLTADEEMHTQSDDEEKKSYRNELAIELAKRLQLERDLTDMRTQMETLRVDMGNIRNNACDLTNRVMYGDKDLVMDFHGKNFVKYAIGVSSYLFTEAELMDNTLEESGKTNRGHLDNYKVRLLKDAVVLKYGLKGEKLDKAWSAIKQAVNQKGRNLKFKKSVKNFLTRGLRRDDENE